MPIENAQLSEVLKEIKERLAYLASIADDEELRTRLSSLTEHIANLDKVA
jgi:hypothetical protein